MSDSPVAIITGGSRGIGRAIATRLAATGHRAVVNFATRPDAAEEVVAEITASGGRAIAVRADIGSAEQREELISRTLDTFGRLDVLVNNAGITSQGRKDLLDATEASWDLVLGTNLKGPFFLSQWAAKAMIDRIHSGEEAGGKIINISSLSAYAVSTNRADYCIAKSALPMMTWLFAERLAEYGIGVFEICPGVIESDMTAGVKQKYDELIAGGAWPIRRWGKPLDVALAVEAVVANRFPFSTGERINVDGGFHIRRL